jgi:hypothetical protein
MATRLERAALRYKNRQADLDAAKENLKREILAALDGGMTEVDAADAAGVSRMTVRAWRGKDQQSE